MTEQALEVATEAKEESSAPGFFQQSDTNAAKIDAEPSNDEGTHLDQMLSEADKIDKEWYLAEGVKAEGEKPDWLKERYNTVADQAKAYIDLEKMVGEFRGAPKDGYQFDHIEGVNTDDPMIKHFSETFKELNLSQAGFDRILTEFNDLQTKATTASMEEEIRSLGPNAKAEINELNQWVNNTFDKETADTVRTWVATAGDFKALQALRSFQPRSAIPTAADAINAASFETSKEVQNEMTQNWKRYNEDENYRSSLRRRLNDSVRREDQKKK